MNYPKFYLLNASLAELAPTGKDRKWGYAGVLRLHTPIFGVNPPEDGQGDKEAR
jgi:hypothetical protein